MPPVEFEPTILASTRRQTYALDRAVNDSSDRLKILILKVADLKNCSEEKLREK
jgi:hypothetical protein